MWVVEGFLTLGVLGVSGVLVVSEVLGVLGVSGVLGVPGVSCVLGVSGVLGIFFGVVSVRDTLSIT